MSSTFQMTLVIARNELRQLVRSKDYLIPLILLGSMFFVLIPGILILIISRSTDSAVVQQASQALSVLPESALSQIRGDTDATRTAYALAVFLFAPVACVVPLTISTAVGAASLVGERERGTGEFLAHSPCSAREVYTGKLIASFIPGYLTTIIGFTLYSLMVNTLVGPGVGGWFFPTVDWVIMMVWVIPAFVLLTLSIVLRLSARVRSTAAAQQASGLVTLPVIGISYAQASGTLMGGGHSSGLLVGAIVWLIAIISLQRGVRSVTRNRLLGVAN